MDNADLAMARYARGDDGAMAILFDLLAPELERWLRRRTRSAADAEELLQETFFRLHQHRGRFRPGEPVRPWLMTIARRLCITHLRHKIVRDRVLAPAGDAMEPGEAPRTEGIVDARRLAARVERELREMPAQHREALLLVRGHSLSLAEAAARLGTTVAAVKLRVFRATDRLRRAAAAVDALPSDPGGGRP